MSSRAAYPAPRLRGKKPETCDGCQRPVGRGVFYLTDKKELIPTGTLKLVRVANGEERIKRPGKRDYVTALHAWLCKVCRATNRGGDA